MSAAPLRTAAWYGDQELELRFPDSWDVSTLWPRTPPRLSDEQIEAIVRDPIGQSRISDLARGAKDPVVILDDLTRPTPTNALCRSSSASPKPPASRRRA